MSVFRGGVPYAIDVKRLNEAFPVDSLAEGRAITHDELEGVLQMSRYSGHRYYSVVNAWKHQLLASTGIFIAWKTTVGVEVLDPKGIQEHANTKTQHKSRQFGRAVRLFDWVPRERLDPTGQQLLDHRRRVWGRMTDAAQAAKKELPIALGPYQSLPKPKPDQNGAKEHENQEDRT